MARWLKISFIHLDSPKYSRMVRKWILIVKSALDKDGRIYIRIRIHKYLNYPEKQSRADTLCYVLRPEG